MIEVREVHKIPKERDFSGMCSTIGGDARIAWLVIVDNNSMGEKNSLVIEIPSTISTV